MIQCDPPDEVTLKWGNGQTLVVGKQDLPNICAAVAARLGRDPSVAMCEAGRTMAYLAYVGQNSVEFSAEEGVLNPADTVDSQEKRGGT